MLDFTPVRNKEMALRQLTSNLTPDRLRGLTNEMIDRMLRQIADCTDANVTFVPNDPEAYDPVAATDGELRMPWTLGHVIVHTTASAEEAAAVASELARGVSFRGGRSRSEVLWTTVSTIAQCRHRLEESRRMRLASLDMWPDHPDLENSYQPDPDVEPRNATIRFVLGLQHDDSHLEQIAEIVRQAQVARV